MTECSPPTYIKNGKIPTRQQLRILHDSIYLMFLPYVTIFTMILTHAKMGNERRLSFPGAARAGGPGYIVLV